MRQRQQARQQQQLLVLVLLRSRRLQHLLHLLHPLPQQQQQQQTKLGPAAALVVASLAVWVWAQASGPVHCQPSGRHRERLVQTQQQLGLPLVLLPAQRRLAAAVVLRPVLLLPGRRLVGRLLLVLLAGARLPLIWVLSCK